MFRREVLTRSSAWTLLGFCALAGWLLLPAQPLSGREDRLKSLRIGTSASLSRGESAATEEAGLKMLRSFIKEETGLENKIAKQKNWRELAGKLHAKKLHLGVFPGDEFAWAREKYPKLHALALGVDGDRYPVAYVVTRRGSKITRFADLRNQTVSIPKDGPHFLEVYLRQECGKKPADFFAKIRSQDNDEDALDDLVDGKVQATVVEKASLEAYRRRKPARFKQIKQVTHSKPFPPMVVAYYDNSLDDASLRRFRSGLVGAVRKDRGRMMLTMFRLNRFEAVPTDFTKVVNQTLISYPPPADEETR